MKTKKENRNISQSGLPHMTTPKASTRTGEKTLCIGVDGTKGGWIAAILEELDLSIVRFYTIEDLCNSYPNASVVLIDIPIGLPESPADLRPDSLLRKSMKGKASSVFSTPCRQALACGDYQKASAQNKKVLDRKLNKQSYAIIPKIKEVDDFIIKHAEWQNRLLESHPEFAFMTLNKNQPVFESKKTKEGQQIRKDLLSRHIKNLDQCLEQLAQFPKKQYPLDDVLDAICLAVIGRFGMCKGFLTIPEKPNLDPQGLKMQIVFANSD